MINKKNIIIVGNLHSHPSSEAFLQKFVKIIKAVGKEVYVISGDKPPVFDNVTWIQPNICIGNNKLVRYIFFIRNQFYIIFILFKYIKNYEFVIILGTGYFLPVLFLKIINKTTALFIAQKTQKALIKLARLNFWIVDVLIVESDSVVNDWRIKKYRHKIMNGPIYVDKIFLEKVYYNERELNIGYIGTLTKNKGVLNFVYAIPEIIAYREDVKFLIVGNGDLYNQISEFLLHNKLDNKVELVKWVPNNEVPHYLNKLKLIVLPSSSEGLPNILLESMSCSTPILATSVGGISSVIKNDITGFIMEDNSKNSIIKEVIRALEYSNIDDIIKNAQDIIRIEYSYDAALKRYKKILGT